jgi:D-sedoheptulose 7-phosphate isomerase
MAADLPAKRCFGPRSWLAAMAEASDSAHFATELACRFVADRLYPAISFTGDGGLMTAIGNDYSFAELFARQVKALDHR